MRPKRMNPVPSVAMNDGTCSATVMNPLIKPATNPKSREMMTARTAGTP